MRIDYDSCSVSGYQRRLDISDAVAEATYLRDGHRFCSRVFASAPDSVIVVRLSSERPFNARVGLDVLLPHNLTISDAGIVADGYAPWHVYPYYYRGVKARPEKFWYDPERGIHFRTRVMVETAGGRAVEESRGIQLQEVNSATIYVVNSTSFNGFDKDPVKEGKPYKTLADANAQKVVKAGYKQIWSSHLKDYQELFQRVSLNLGSTPDSVRRLPTNVQLRRYTDLEESNPELEALFYQYGRYLLICSSRTEGVPATLQGLWNSSLEPPWGSNYTININLQESYWLAEPAGLGEMNQVLLSFIHHLSQVGEPVSHRFYGTKRGWNAGHNSDIWAMANPVGLGTGKTWWANWTMGGAWLSTHIWEHYLYSRSIEDLRRDYPVLKGAATFCLDFMIEKDGELITSPSTFPENRYLTPDGFKGASLYGATADIAIIRECLTDAVCAAKELGVDDDFVAEAELALGKLHPYQVDAEGKIQEWYHEWEDAQPQHRHQSHLVGVYPGHQILSGPLAEAALKTLEVRGMETTGWSSGWRINLYARLDEGEKAYQVFRNLLRYVSPDKYTGPDAVRGSGTYPNLFNACPPFTMDGNYGACAGVMEMLLYSGPDGTLKPLVGLPSAWPSGHVKGLRTRRGTAVDITWKDGRLVSMKERHIKKR